MNHEPDEAAARRKEAENHTEPLVARKSLHCSSCRVRYAPKNAVKQSNRYYCPRCRRLLVPLEDTGDVVEETPQPQLPQTPKASTAEELAMLGTMTDSR